MKNPWIVIGVIVALLVGGSLWLGSSAGETYNEGVEIKAHTMGSDAAAVTLTEYSDFQCPACGQFQPVVEEILAQYGDSLKFEYKHFPLIQIHPYAEPAAIAAEAAGQQGKFFEYAHLLFTNQAVWSKSNPAAFFAKYAEEVGLDVEQFTRQQKSSVIKAHVRAQFDEARALGLTSTPSFYLNGQKMNITTIDDFKAQIAAAFTPNVDFNVDGMNAPVKVIEVGDGATSAPAAATNGAAEESVAPAVQFGI
jgi:protein-disulfide isomerase